MTIENKAQQRFGLSAALTTPFDEQGRIDTARAIAHAKWCLANGCSSVTLFGTTGEGSSIADAERGTTFAALVKGGIAASQIIVGVMANAAGDAARQSAEALAAGCKAILLAPPSYFKNLAEDGIFAWFSEVLQALGSNARDIILYNIPSVTAVELPINLITRLRQAFGAAIIGVKDSSGNFAYTEQLLARHKDIAILVGDERDLAQAVRMGAQGAISGMANLVPHRMLPMINAGQNDEALVAAVNRLLNYPVTPSVKAMLARRNGDAGWRRARAPLLSMKDADYEALGAIFDGLYLAKAA